jgi:hypothetical protein
LNLLNDPVFFEAAQVLAVRILREERGNLSDRLNYAFQLCLGREPKPQERDRLISYLDDQKKILQRNPDLIKNLPPVKEIEGIDPADAAIWVGLSSLLLNLDEFITRS